MLGRPAVAAAFADHQEPERSSTQTIAYNRELAKDCKANTGPVFDHIDTLQTVRDLDAIRAALGEHRS